VTRVSSWSRVTVISCSISDLQSSMLPVTGAALVGIGLQLRGMWPSPAKRPDVGSRPTQPAPGRYTSVQAWRSVKSCSAPDGPSRDFSSALSWIR